MALLAMQDVNVAFGGPPVLDRASFTIEKGERVHFTGEFEPGRYGLICFVPDAETGRPHFLHGMTTEFTVE